MNSEALKQGHNSGLKAALELPCDDYFANGPQHLRRFIDDHYDNFYTYYFAGRTYDARSKLAATEAFRSKGNNWCLSSALDNLGKLDGVYKVDNLNQLANDVERNFQPIATNWRWRPCA